jgi:hypothetical protein
VVERQAGEGMKSSIAQQSERAAERQNRAGRCRPAALQLGCAAAQGLHRPPPSRLSAPCMAQRRSGRSTRQGSKAALASSGRCCGCGRQNKERSQRAFGRSTQQCAWRAGEEASAARHRRERGVLPRGAAAAELARRLRRAAHAAQRLIPLQSSAARVRPSLRPQHGKHRTDATAAAAGGERGARAWARALMERARRDLTPPRSGRALASPLLSCCGAEKRSGPSVGVAACRCSGWRLLRLSGCVPHSPLTPSQGARSCETPHMLRRELRHRLHCCEAATLRHARGRRRPG